MIKFPLEYELTPSLLEAGRHWVTLHLKNIGTENLTGLDVKLNSLDASPPTAALPWRQQFLLLRTCKRNYRLSLWKILSPAA